VTEESRWGEGGGGDAGEESVWGEGGGGDAGEESSGWLGSEPRLGFGALRKARGKVLCGGRVVGGGVRKRG
jgi:hypothetical protein